MSEELVEAMARKLCIAFNDEADRTRETWAQNPTDTLVLWRAAAREAIRCMEWARRLSAGELDSGGCSIALGTARDAICHHLSRKHFHNPSECEGCEFSDDAMRRISSINGKDGYLPLTLPPEGWKP